MTVIKRAVHLGAFILVGVYSAFAGNTAKLDGRRLFSPQTSPSVQTTSFVNTVELQHSVANTLTSERPAELDITNFPIPGMEDATLNLHRTRDVYDANTVFIQHVKGGTKNLKLAPVVSYTGTIQGDPTSKVTLHYSGNEMVGFISTNGNRILVGPQLGAKNAVATTSHLIGYEASLSGQDPLENFICGTNESYTPEPASPSVNTKDADVVQNNYLKKVDVSVVLQEHLFEYIKSYNSYTDEQVAQYIMKIFACVSQPYEEEIDVALYVNYYEAFTNDNPSGFVNNGGDPDALLYEFSREWSARPNNPVRSVAHIMTKLPDLGGGVAGVGRGADFSTNLCRPKDPTGGSYSVSSLRGRPRDYDVPGVAVVRNGFVWDVFVVAHELGHNFGARHTHNCSWGPGFAIDTCVTRADDNTDACPAATKRNVITGTIMSYCHLHNGESTALTFGGRTGKVATKMREWTSQASCVVLVSQPTIRISSPRGAEEFRSGNVTSILWSSQQVSNVKIQYTQDLSTDNWTTIAASVSATNRKYDWKIPETVLNGFYIRVVSVDNEQVGDTTLAAYSIKPKLLVVNPTAGARIGTNTKIDVQWLVNDVDTVKVEYSTDGVKWDTIATNVRASLTKVSWTIPNISTETARVRITSKNGAITTTSGLFAIGNPVFELVTPKTGDRFCKNSPTLFEWTADFVERVRVQFSTNNGGQWKTLASSQEVAPGQAYLFSAANLAPLAPETQISIQVSLPPSNGGMVLATVSGLIIDSCEVTSVDNGADGNTSALQFLAVSPNASGSELSIRVLSDRAGTASVMLVDMAGEIRTLANDVSLTESVSSLAVPIQDVASGMYQLVLRVGQNSAYAPLSIIR